MPPAQPHRAPAAPRLVSFASLLVAACAAAAAPLTVTVTDDAGQPLEGALVYVVAKGQPARAPAGATVQIEQRGKKFVPQISVVQVGTAVRFPNNDAVRHHVYSFSPTRTFELPLYAAGTTPSEAVVFDKPGTVEVGCNVHDRMHAWVHVVDSPLHALTGADGRATLDVPAGTHRLRARHHLQPDAATAVDQALQVGGAAAQAALRIALAPAAAEHRHEH